MKRTKNEKVYHHISNVARMHNIHPQTLRLYEREGLLKPSRSEGNTRLYSDEDLQRLEPLLSFRHGCTVIGLALNDQCRRRAFIDIC